MPSFLTGDGGNNNGATTMTTTPGIENGHASKGRFSLFRKKGKAIEAVPQLQLLPLPSPTLELAPPTPSPEAPKPAPTSKPRKVTRKSSTVIDDELRSHLQREGYAFIAFTDPARAAAHSNDSPAEPVARKAKESVDRAESSRSHGTLLKDAVELMEKKSVETTRPAVRNLISPAVPVQAAVPEPAPVRVAKPPAVFAAPVRVVKSPVVLAAPQSRVVAAPVAKVENVFPKRTDSASAPAPPVPAVPGPTISGVGSFSGLQMSVPRMAQEGASSSRPPVQQHSPEESIMDRKITRKTRKSSDQRNKDSGKDVDSSTSSGPSQRSSPVYPVEPSIGATESPAMARFAQGVSMHNVDPWISKNRKSDGHADRKQSSGPPPERMGFSTSGPSRDYNQDHNRDQQYAPRPTPRSNNQGNRGLTNPGSQTQTPIIADEERRQSDTSTDENPRRSLPIPVMLPPDGYTSTLNRLQLDCQISHRQTVVSSNLHHRIICMVCQTDAPSERWSCSYCALRFCSRCKSEFSTGSNFEQVLEKAATKEWRSQQVTTLTHARAPGNNISWELACVLEAGGRLRGYGLRPQQQGRRPPPPMGRRSPIYNSGGERSPAHRSSNSSPEERISLMDNQSPSPTYSADRLKTSSGSSSSHRHAGGAVSPSSSYGDAPTSFDREAKRKAIERVMGGGRKSGRCSPGITSGTAAEQRRALLGERPY